MSLTRKMLKAMGIDETQADQIIEAHVETVDGLKNKYADYDNLKTSVETITKERDELKTQNADYKTQSETVASLTEENTALKNARDLQAKQTLFTTKAKEAGIAEKYIPALMKITDLNADMESEDFVNSLKTEHADFVVSTTTEVAQVATPPQTAQTEIEPKSLADALRQHYKK